MKYFWRVVLVLYVVIPSPIFIPWRWLSEGEIELYDTWGNWIAERCEQ